MEVRDSSTRTLYVSGTASIEPAGRTVHAGNAAKQIETTMEVVCALIEEAGMVLTDTTRAIAYFRHSEHIPLWHDYCRKRQLLPLPIILIPSDICRDDLLFEIELDAARALDCDNDSTQNLRRRQNSRSCIPLKLFSE
jgi:enamine deaminase RidA (YjgF/YER057c/UK114 family)